jgi:putative hydrolase of the HAD superfamily
VHHAVNAVLFDLDNTLADRERAFRARARWFAQERLGLVHERAIDETVGGLIALDAEGRTAKDLMFATLRLRYPALTEEVTTLVDAFRQQLLGHLPPLDAGAASLLDRLDRTEIPWGIVTNGSESQLRKVEKLNLADRAACVVVSDVIGVRKPAPAIFHAAAASLGAAPPRVLFVGDHPEADVIGAAQAGMQTAWLRRGREWPAHLAPAPPHLTVDSLDELVWIAADQTEPKPPADA